MIRKFLGLYGGDSVETITIIDETKGSIKKNKGESTVAVVPDAKNIRNNSIETRYNTDEN